jgi:hypothetical protein
MFIPSDTSKENAKFFHASIVQTKTNARIEYVILFFASVIFSSLPLLVINLIHSYIIITIAIAKISTSIKPTI